MSSCEKVLGLARPVLPRKGETKEGEGEGWRKEQG